MKITSYKKADGRTYYAVKGFLGVDRNKKKRNMTKRGFTNKTDARVYYLSAVQAFKESQGLAERPRIKMSDLVDKWLVSYELTVGESTYNKTETHMRLYVKPEFGEMFADQITKQMVVKALHDWLGRTTKVKAIMQYLNRVLQHGVDLNYLDRNPADGVKVPKQHNEKREEKVFKYMEKQELNQFLDIAEKNLSKDWYTFFRLLAMSGLRRGEALALTGDDIDGDLISVNKTLANGKKYQVIIGPPKTPKSRRVVRVDKVTADLLNNLKQGDMPIFRREDGSHWYLTRPTHLLDWLHEKCGAPKVNPHMFRHTHTVLMLEAGVGIAEVQERLGHEKVTMTLEIYNHVSAKKAHSAVDKLTAFLTD